MGKHLRIYSLLLLLALATWPVLSAEVEGEFIFSVGDSGQTEANSQGDRELESELKKVQVRLDELEDQLQRANQKKNEVYNLLHQLEIQGSSRTQLRNFQLSGDRIDTAADFLGRPLWFDPLEPAKQLTGSKANEQIRLTLIGRPIPQIEMAGNFDFLVTWAGSKKIGPADEIYIKADFDRWQTIAGTYWAQFSPLTLFYPIDRPRFEGELFAQKRNNALREQGIKDNARRLEGFYGQMNLEELIVQGLVARVGTSPYHRFLWGLRGDLTATPELNLTGTWVSLKDDLASAKVGKAADSQLMGFAGEYRWDNLAFSGEFIRSSYDDDILGGLPPAFDTAAVGELNWSRNNVELGGRFLNVGPFYSAPTVQSRDYSLKEQSIFGPAQATTAMGGKVESAENQTLPYGFATPNRRGVQFKVNYQTSWGDFFIEHWQLAEIKASEAGKLTGAFSEKRNFYVERVGGEVPITELIRHSSFSFPRKPTIIRGSWERRHINRGQDPDFGGDTKLAKSEIISDLALSYQLVPGWELLMAGKRQSWQDQALDTEKSQDTLGVGVRTKINSVSFIQLSLERFYSQDAEGSIAGLVVETQF